MALLVVIVVVLTAFIYWDNFISSDSPFGVVRRTISYLETDPEVRALPILLAMIPADHVHNAHTSVDMYTTHTHITVEQS